MQRHSLFLFIAANLAIGIAAHAQTLPLGTVENVQSVACPSGFAPGSSCEHLTIHACPKVSDIGVTTGTLSGRLGTIVLFRERRERDPPGARLPMIITRLDIR